MQRYTIWALMGLALGLIGGITGPAARADDPASQPQTDISLDGTIDHVDVDRDRVILNTDNSRTYTLDTYHSKIILPDTDKPGITGDLASGMRLHVAGTLLSRDIVEADQVTVLMARGRRPVTPVAPVDNRPPRDEDDQSVTLRGTVESVDDRRSQFVVHVNDHTRTIDIDDQTDLQDLDARNGDDRIPLRVGDRVTVAGVFQDDGTVLAHTISRNRIPATPENSRDDNDRAPSRRDVLTGPITQQSNHYASRDIKVRIAADEEITVHVPHNIPIRREGRAISVHDLTRNDVVRIQGEPDGQDFKASRIDVLRSNDDGD